MGFLQNEFCSPSADNWGCLQEISTLTEDGGGLQTISLISLFCRLGEMRLILQTLTDHHVM